MELSIFSFFTVWINIILYILIIINLLIPNNLYIINCFEILYSLIITISICGLIIHIWYMDKIIYKYKKSKEYQILKPYIGKNFKLILHIINIITHIISLLLILNLVSDKSNITKNQIYQIYVILICMYIYLVDIPSNVYIGTPNWLLYGLAPLILILSTYIRKNNL